MAIDYEAEYESEGGHFYRRGYTRRRGQKSGTRGQLVSVRFGSRPKLPCWSWSVQPCVRPVGAVTWECSSVSRSGLSFEISSLFTTKCASRNYLKTWRFLSAALDMDVACRQE
jgi:hypothetical protein